MSYLNTNKEVVVMKAVIWETRSVSFGKQEAKPKQNYDSRKL